MQKTLFDHRVNYVLCVVFFFIIIIFVNDCSWKQRMTGCSSSPETFVWSPYVKYVLCVCLIHCVNYCSWKQRMTSCSSLPMNAENFVWSPYVKSVSHVCLFHYVNDFSYRQCMMSCFSSPSIGVSVSYDANKILLVKSVFYVCFFSLTVSMTVR